MLQARALREGIRCLALVGLWFDALHQTLSIMGEVRVAKLMP